MLLLKLLRGFQCTLRKLGSKKSQPLAQSFSRLFVSRFSNKSRCRTYGACFVLI